MLAWATPEKKKKSSGIGDRAFLKCLDEVAGMLADGQWSKAKGRHFVALYADLHTRIYGVEPIDLGPKERMFASRMADMLLEKQFEGDPDRMAKFIAWTWSREKEREAWRRRTPSSTSGYRIDWRLQFGPRLLVDFRISESRAAQG